MNAATSNKKLETFALSLSMYGYAAMAVAGLVFAGLTGLGAILLDGAYSLVSFVMVLIAGDDVRCYDIGQLDDIRGNIAAALAGCHPRLVLDVVFTAADRWVLGLVGSEKKER